MKLLDIIAAALAFAIFNGVTALLTPTFIPFSEEAWWMQNRETGILEGDSFSVFSFDYAYMSLHIDGHKMKAIDKDADQETEQIVRLLMHQKKKAEVFLNAYAIPKLQPGQHTVNISLSKKKPGQDKVTPLTIIDVTMKCEVVPLLFFLGETCECRLNETSIVLRHRPKWLD